MTQASNMFANGGFSSFQSPELVLNDGQSFQLMQYFLRDSNPSQMNCQMLGQQLVPPLSPEQVSQWFAAERIRTLKGKSALIQDQQILEATLNQQNQERNHAILPSDFFSKQSGKDLIPDNNTVSLTGSQSSIPRATNVSQQPVVQARNSVEAKDTKPAEEPKPINIEEEKVDAITQLGQLLEGKATLSDANQINKFARIMHKCQNDAEITTVLNVIVNCNSKDILDGFIRSKVVLILSNWNRIFAINSNTNSLLMLQVIDKLPFDSEIFKDLTFSKFIKKMTKSEDEGKANLTVAIKGLSNSVMTKWKNIIATVAETQKRKKEEETTAQKKIKLEADTSFFNSLKSQPKIKKIDIPSRKEKETGGLTVSELLERASEFKSSSTTSDLPITKDDDIEVEESPKETFDKNGKKKKTVKFKPESMLLQIRYFDLEESPNAVVSQYLIKTLNPNAHDPIYQMQAAMKAESELVEWGTPIELDVSHAVTVIVNSKQKAVQEQRELSALSVNYFSARDIPPSPAEPDSVEVPYVPPIEWPLNTKVEISAPLLPNSDLLQKLSSLVGSMPLAANMPQLGTVPQMPAVSVPPVSMPQQQWFPQTAPQIDVQALSSLLNSTAFPVAMNFQQPIPQFNNVPQQYFPQAAMPYPQQNFQQQYKPNNKNFKDQRNQRGEKVQMQYSSERPLTSRTRKRIEQLVDDEEMALNIALEEDAKIAKKLQEDYDKGVAVEDYHRIQTPHTNTLKIEPTTEDEISHFSENELKNYHDSDNLKDDLIYKSGDDLAYKPEDFLGHTPKYNAPRTKTSEKDSQKGSITNIEKRPESVKSIESTKINPSTEAKIKFESQRASFNKKEIKPSTPSSASGSDEYPLSVALQDDPRKTASTNIKKSPVLTRSNQSLDSKKETTLKSSINQSDIEKEMKSLIDMIGLFHPESVELEPTLCPFLPDYIPCIGDIDPIIKIPKPNGEQKSLGLEVLDEPNAMQSDPAVVDLSLRAHQLEKSPDKMKIRSIKIPVTVTPKDQEQITKSLDIWIKTVNDIHSKQSVRKNDIDLERLMAEWPQEIDNYLPKIDLPNANIDLKLKDYVQLCCNILDIPLMDSKVKKRVGYVHSLSKLFELYSEFKNSQHFGRP
ncbi:Intraflagellar transport protein 46 [Boothiomyces sp. JEL0866]|nr:Intraflagellar transport protein 46 [Boothiomyces sp. JEL0866]